MYTGMYPKGGPRLVIPTFPANMHTHNQEVVWQKEVSMLYTGQYNKYPGMARHPGMEQ